ncbi:MAG: tetratricopeptide repeat protein [Bdellovibrionota bacterium]
MTTADKIETWLVDNAKLVVALFIGVLVIGGVLAGYQAYSSARENKAQETLFEIEADLEKKQQALFEVENKQKQEASKNKAAKKTETAAPVRNPETLQKDLGEPLTRLVSFIDQNKGSKASYMAAMTASDLYLEYKDPSQAAQLLEKVAPHVNKKDLFYGLLNSQLALAYSNANECPKAVDVYDDIIDSEAQKHIHAQMILRKGVCLMSMKEYDKAKAAFRQAKTDFPDSVSGKSAESFERLINVKKGVVK